jgi:hypothetical protein
MAMVLTRSNFRSRARPKLLCSRISVGLPELFAPRPGPEHG